MTDHPRDEFDTVPESSARQGVHRERLIPGRSSGLGLKITVGILALLIGLGAYFILPRLGLTAGDGGSAASSSTTSSADPEATLGNGATADPTVTDGATSGGSATGDASPTARATEEADSSATATDESGSPGSTDRAQTINVLNGTGTPGLASVAAGRLESAGWSSAIPGNWAEAPLDSSVVFYNGEAQRASAEAVAADLGITDLIDSPDVSPDIAVVLGPGFQ